MRLDCRQWVSALPQAGGYRSDYGSENTNALVAYDRGQMRQAGLLRRRDDSLIAISLARRLRLAEGSSGVRACFGKIRVLDWHTW